MTRLTRLVQVSIGLMVILLVSQVGLWMELRKLNERFAGLDSQTSRIEAQLTEINNKLNKLGVNHA